MKDIGLCLISDEIFAQQVEITHIILILMQYIQGLTFLIFEKGTESRTVRWVLLIFQIMHRCLHFFHILLRYKRFFTWT